MIPFAALSPAWFLSLILIGSAEQGRMSLLVDASSQVQVSMTPVDVRKIMGQPDVAMKADDFWQLAFLGFHSGQWYWASTVDLGALPGTESGKPNPFPFHWRLFSYHRNDLVICWDANDRVTEVRRPELNPSPLSVEMYRGWQFVRDITIMLATDSKQG